MIHYYDGILGLIPVVLIGTVGLLHGLGFALSSAVPVASAIAGLLVGHALFVNAPVEPQSDTA